MVQKFTKWLEQWMSGRRQPRHAKCHGTHGKPFAGRRYQRRLTIEPVAVTGEMP